jgi:UDP-N-acetylglucosamine--N-acetylmuramyl-(pentapeptide) pyrophosphoryl-undecaprenol N-acetylglucosamine transferase
MSTSSAERTLSVVIAGGGTGGHLYPGIAVAREIQRRRPTTHVSFAGTARGLEATIVPREGFAIDLIRSAGLKNKSRLGQLRGLALILPGIADAWNLLSRRRPDVVVGVGGYSSGPVVLAAALRRIPTLVLEQNAMPGLANRLLAPFVRAAAVTYADTLPLFRGKGFVAGNPVRAEFFRPSPGGRARPPAPRVLVLGGSQGAHAINVAVTEAAPMVVERHPETEWVHQTGERDVMQVRDAYAGHALRARAEAFIDRMADEMNDADLIVCRAGATTLAELAAIGRPAVLVPFPAAADDHQRKNARVLADAGAAVVVDERDLTPARLAAAVDELLADRTRLERMATAMRAFARPDAASLIVDRLLALAGASDPAPTREVGG